jgi:tetratricopeptide (TPR) repeat protein
MCLERPDSRVPERLKAMAAIDSLDATAHICQGVAFYLSGHFEEAMRAVEQAASLDPQWGDPYFWKGMVSASLGQEEEAMAAIARALELRLPPVLLTPLCWLDKDRQDFYEKYVEPLLTRYNVLNHQETTGE